MSLSNAEKVERINRWQACPFVHPLTCTEPNCDGEMEARMQKEGQGLMFYYCKKCGRHMSESMIPEMVYYINYDQFDALQRLIDQKVG